MESGFDANFSIDGGQILWQNGQDLSQTVSELASSSLVESSEESSEESQEVIYVQTGEYSLGHFGGYTADTLGTLALYGICAGFGLAIGISLLTYAIRAVASAFRVTIES